MTKISNPGILQVKRFRYNQENVADVIYDVNIPWEGDCQVVDPFDSTRVRTIKKGMQSQDLLQPIFRQGVRVCTMPSLNEIRQHAKRELEHFNVGIKRFLNPHLYMSNGKGPLRCEISPYQ